MNTCDSQASGIPQDQQVHIYCPDCDYDVTGLTENRCPECGAEFDATRLRSWATHTAASPTYGPRQQIKYLQLAAAALFHPARLARDLPPNPSLAASFRYSLILKLLATFVFPLFLVDNIFDGGGTRLASFQVPIIFSSMICEWVIAVLLGRFVDARSVDPKNRFRFWLTLSNCFTAHMAATSAIIAALFLIMSGLAQFPGLKTFLNYTALSLWVIPLMTSLWWWHGLGTAISVRGFPGTARTAIVFLIPLVALACMVLGTCIFALEMYFSYVSIVS
jgi:hypothetical protein